MKTLVLPNSIFSLFRTAYVGDERHNLQTICITPRSDVVECVTTDGHRLTRAVVQAHADNTLTAPVLLSAFVSPKGKGEARLTIHDDGRVDVTIDMRTVVARVYDGIFPNYSQVIPAPEAYADAARLPTPAAGLNLEYVADAAAIAKAIVGRKGVGGKFQVKPLAKKELFADFAKGTLDPVRIEVDGSYNGLPDPYVELTFVIMPMRL